MESEEIGLGIIFHSGSYDRIYHGIAIDLAGLALGREVKLFFSYWALEYLKRGQPPLFILDKEAEMHKQILEKNVERGHLHKISELVAQTKSLGAKFYVCTSSLGLFNITPHEAY